MARNKQMADYEYADLPAEGTLTIDLGKSPVPYIHEVSFWLLIAGETPSAWIPGYTFLKTAGVQVRRPYDSFFFGKDPYYDFCPLTEAHGVEAVYQPYEDGFLLWRGDSNMIYTGLSSDWVCQLHPEHLMRLRYKIATTTRSTTP
jgi:hypothetical protein